MCPRSQTPYRFLAGLALLVAALACDKASLYSDPRPALLTGQAASHTPAALTRAAVASATPLLPSPSLTPLPPGEAALAMEETRTWFFTRPASGQILLSLEARIDLYRTAGSWPALQLTVNDQPVSAAQLVNKPPAYRFAGGSDRPYFIPHPTPDAAGVLLCTLFYSPDWQAVLADGDAYQVVSPEPYRYVFDITTLVTPGINRLALTNRAIQLASYNGLSPRLVYRSLSVYPAGEEVRPVRLTPP